MCFLKLALLPLPIPNVCSGISFVSFTTFTKIPFKHNMAKIPFKTFPAFSIRSKHSSRVLCALSLLSRHSSFMWALILFYMSRYLNSKGYFIYLLDITGKYTWTNLMKSHLFSISTFSPKLYKFSKMVCWFLENIRSALFCLLLLRCCLHAKWDLWNTWNLLYSYEQKKSLERDLAVSFSLHLLPFLCFLINDFFYNF